VRQIITRSSNTSILGVAIVAIATLGPIGCSESQALAEANTRRTADPVPLLFLGELARQDGKLADARRYLGTAASLPLPENWPASHRKRFHMLLDAERSQLK
jgi:hypothetical protein